MGLQLGKGTAPLPQPRGEQGCGTQGLWITAFPSPHPQP